MRILLRQAPDHIWKVVDSLTYEAETELQQILADDPTLIPIADIRQGLTRLCVGVREFAVPNSGSVDVLAFSAEGDLAIIECKLEKNPEIKHKVVGQLFEYASFIWQMSYDELDQRVQDRAGRGLIDLVKAAAPDVDAGEFRAAISERLRTGDFLLVIVVDNITPDAVRFGAGKVTGSFIFEINSGKRRVTLFYIDTGGLIYFACLSWQALPSDLVSSFRQQLSGVPGFSDVVFDPQEWPSKPLTIFHQDPKSLSAFKSVVEQFQMQLQADMEQTGV